MKQRGRRLALDLDVSSLSPGGVCASALNVPFRNATFDVVAAFDVIEHCEPESQALTELARVLRPGGRLFLAVPAYQWAWTDFDVMAGHHRRYTRPRLVRAVQASGMTVERATYIFAGAFPVFAAERLVRKLRKPSGALDKTLPEPTRTVECLLLGLCELDRRILKRRNLPFGSSVVVVATKPGG
jgi:SAM-dependent methyltransferase